MINIGIMTNEEFDKIIASEKMTIIDFSAVWCGPCKMMQPVLEDASDKHKGEINFFKADVDSLGDIAARFQISAVPTLVAFKGGKEVARISGFMPLEDLENFIKYANQK